MEFGTDAPRLARILPEQVWDRANRLIAVNIRLKYLSRTASRFTASLFHRPQRNSHDVAEYGPGVPGDHG